VVKTSTCTSTRPWRCSTSTWRAIDFCWNDVAFLAALSAYALVDEKLYGGGWKAPWRARMTSSWTWRTCFWPGISLGLFWCCPGLLRDVRVSWLLIASVCVCFYLGPGEIAANFNSWCLLPPYKFWSCALPSVAPRDHWGKVGAQMFVGNLQESCNR
jgi:hypothetical protein